MKFNLLKPFNEQPDLPPDTEIETKEISSKAFNHKTMEEILGYKRL